MFGSANSGANAYAKVDVETGVVAANPHKLVVMLLEGAMIAIASAIQQMQAGDIAGKGKSLSKAITIIDEGLRASLDKKAGGEIALNLDALYEYMNSRLMIANLKNQPKTMEEVHQLLKGLKDAWEAIGPTANATANTASAAPIAGGSTEQAPKTMSKAALYDSLTPQSSRLVKA